MKKFHILLIVVLGLFLIPRSAFACGMHSGKHSCKNETSSKTDKDDCCGNDNHSKNKSHDGCGGKCGHSKCGCASVCSGGTTFVNTIELKRNSFIPIFVKEKFHHSETTLSSGFNSLWLIPKIS